jgi:hypothetical protein
MSIDILEQAKADAEAFTATDDELKSLQVLVKRLLKVEDQLSDLEIFIKKLTAEKEKLSKIDIPDKMDEIGTTSFSVKDDGGNEFSIKCGTDYRTSIKEENMEAALAWLKKEGHDGIVKPYLYTPYSKGELDLAEATMKRMHEAGFNDVTLKYDINWQTFRKFTREMEEEGTPLPEDLFSVYSFRTTKIK